MFQAKVGIKFAALCILDSDVDTLANNLEEELLSTAEEVRGRQGKKIQLNGSQQGSESVRPETALKQQKYTCTEAGLEYRNSKREVRKKMKAAKEEWIEKQCKNIGKGVMSEEHRRGLRNTQGSHQDPSA